MYKKKNGYGLLTKTMKDEKTEKTEKKRKKRDDEDPSNTEKHSVKQLKRIKTANDPTLLPQVLVLQPMSDSLETLLQTASSC